MSAPKIHVHLEKPAPRARYAVEEVLGTMLGWEVVWEDDRERYAVSAGPRLFYGEHAPPGVFHVRPAGLLSGETLVPVTPEVVHRDALPLLFPVAGGHLPFDPFAAAFFLLTRYEELLGLDRDMHGRPVAAGLHGALHGYLERPIVDEWALLLADVWRARDPEVPAPQRRYRLVNTIDLDNGFKYLGRPLWRTIGSAIRDAALGAWAEVPLRFKVLAGRADDPFDIYDVLKGPLSDGADRVIFFVLTAERGTWDHAVPVTYPPYSERLRTLTNWAEVGLHPSYRSSEQFGMTALESLALGDVLGRPVRITRQHFLRMRLPDTYRELEAMGVEEEHSMGLHEHLGFRAGTCTPYRWYDLGKERRTALCVHPFAVMDNTLREKLHLGPGEAVERVAALISRVKAVQGTFTGLWHESFLAHGGSAAPWREAILRIIQLARP
jgi:hypothetical protein